MGAGGTDKKEDGAGGTALHEQCKSRRAAALRASARDSRSRADAGREARVADNWRSVYREQPGVLLPAA